MSDSSLSRPAFMTDADYQAAQRFLHLGEWARAQVLLEILDRRYPEVGAIAQSLVLTQLKADLDTRTPVRGQRWVLPWRVWARRAVLLLGLLLIMGGAAWIVATGAAPGLSELARLRLGHDLDAKIATGNELVAAGQYDEAEAYFTQLLAESPASPELQVALAGVAEARQLRALYDQAAEAEAQGDLTTAMDLLRSVVARQADFADVTRRLARLERHQVIDGLIVEANELRGLGLNDLVAARMEEARTLELAYRREEVAAILVTAYSDLAQAILQADPPQPERLPEVLTYLDQVLNLDTANQAAADERRRVRLYLEGREFAAQQDYDLAATRWQTLYDERPDYLQGALLAALYDAILADGDRFREAGNCATALDQYNLALTLPVTDSVLALGRIMEMQACLPPTPALLPDPTATP